MAKFIFSMSSILSLKSRIEEQKRQELGEAITKLEDEKAIFEEFNKQKQISLVKLKHDMNDKINAVNFKNINNYIEFIKKKISIQMDVIIEAEKHVEKKRLELLEATKEKKMFEKIKEKKYEEYIAEEKKQEQKVIDEIVSYKYNE